MPRGYLPKPQSTAPRGAPRHSPATASTIDRLIERIGLVSAVREAQRVGSHASGPESPRLHAGHIHIEIGRDRPSSQTDLQFLWRCNGSRGGGGDELSGTECQSVCSSSRERYDPVIHPTCNVSGSVVQEFLDFGASAPSEFHDQLSWLVPPAVGKCNPDENGRIGLIGIADAQCDLAGLFAAA